MSKEFKSAANNFSILSTATNNFSDENLFTEGALGKNLVIKYNAAEEELDKMIGPSLRKQMATEAFMRRFKDLAYECLKQQLVQRPTMDQIVKELEGVSWEHAELGETVVLLRTPSLPWNTDDVNGVPQEREDVWTEGDSI
ncbi:hypothetical protein L1987_37347 [Smallanthus sonchifolius]|uniref:Uncharacterized protein n=1 Tax=Smallanthus sonchifolius TaxID=185202 RepID=A0ACB9HIN9_9ASTR|nr:hypothetical protein L1987_37347 [Smallanthus sonchifolius]